jgi:CO/xanthine dehydrogenase FAD-binding subunit
VKELDYFNAYSIDEALNLLNRYKEDTKIIASGTDLLVRLKDNLIKENIIVDISRIKELKRIYEDGDYLHILPLATHAEIIESPLIQKFAFILRDACLTIGSPQIRNRGTLGGNVANASPAGDSIPALFVLGANVKLKSVEGERIVGIEEFFTGPGKTQMKQNEMLVDIFFPEIKDNETGFFKKLGQRNAMAIAIANVAVKLRVSQNNSFENALVSFGAVAPTVVRARLVEKALVESSIDSSDKILYVSRLAFREVMPITDVRGSDEYRREMSTNLLYEGLLELYNNGWRRYHE